MTAPSGQLRIYTADTAPLSDAALFADAYRAVSPERRARTDRLRFERDKRLSLGAELLLRHACRALGIRYEAERIVEDAYQKPAFAACPVRFNLSHSGERVMCVTADTAVGCDTEQMREADLRLAGRFFCPEEYAALLAEETEEARRVLFFRLWTLKESFQKCVGLGFALPLNAFCVRTRGTEATVEQSLDTARYRFFEQDPGDGYRYACCVRLPAEDTACPVPVRQTVDLSKAL